MENFALENKRKFGFSRSVGTVADALARRNEIRADISAQVNQSGTPRRWVEGTREELSSSLGAFGVNVAAPYLFQNANSILGAAAAGSTAALSAIGAGVALSHELLQELIGLVPNTFESSAYLAIVGPSVSLVEELAGRPVAQAYEEAIQGPAMARARVIQLGAEQVQRQGTLGESLRSGFTGPVRRAQRYAESRGRALAPRFEQAAAAWLIAEAPRHHPDQGTPVADYRPDNLSVRVLPGGVLGRVEQFPRKVTIQFTWTSRTNDTFRARDKRVTAPSTSPSGARRRELFAYYRIGRGPAAGREVNHQRLVEFNNLPNGLYVVHAGPVLGRTNYEYARGELTVPLFVAPAAVPPPVDPQDPERRRVQPDERQPPAPPQPMMAGLPWWAIPAGLGAAFFALRK